MSTHALQELKKLYAQFKDETIENYFTFLKFESISTEEQFTPNLLACSKWLATYLKEIGLDVDIWQTSGHPVVFASYTKAGKEAPTLLIYNHYDVQPVDPLELWHSPPFHPTVREGEVYARGAVDDKGQCFYTIQALKALLKRDGKLPINIKMCIEGEEEKGSLGLSQILKSKAKELQADYLAVVDMGIPAPNTPAVTLGVRGICCLEVEMTGSKGDLHSGQHGGIAYNPLHAMVELLAKLRDPATGKVTVPGFYDDILPLSEEEKKQLTAEFDLERYQKEFEVDPVGGEKGFSTTERISQRPTIEINGINGGYSGPGFKTVIPAKALAKISCRLVPNQDPAKVSAKVIDFLKKQAPKGVKTEIRLLPGDGMAVRASPNSRIVKSFVQAYEEIFQKPCKQTLSGGSIPILAELAKASQASIVLLGMGLATDQIHAPNEHFGLDRLEKGFLLIARTIEILGNR